MPVSLAPSPRQQYTDANGQPIVGGQLFTYLSNTSTKSATYTDGSGASANTNPIILDEQGRIPSGLFLINGVSYSFVLAIATDTDPPTSPIFTENDITGINDTTAIDAEYALLAAQVSDMANDAILSAVEKSILRKEWDVIANEKITLEAQATTYSITTQKTAYTAAWVALADYLNNSVTWTSGVPLWLSDAELGNDTVIVPATFRLTFRTYYDTRTTLIKQITDVANTNTSAAALTAYWESVTNRPTDLTSLDPSSAYALWDATEHIADIASDGRFTPVEKINIRRAWDTIAIEKAIIEAQADIVNVAAEKAAYSAAWVALADYLNDGVTWTSGVPNWINDTNISVTTTIVGSTFRSRFTSYYQALSTLQKKITDAANSLTVIAQNTANAAHAAIGTIASDDYFSPVEKTAIRKEWDALYSERELLVPQAAEYGITTEKTAYDTYFIILSTYLNNGTSWTTGIPSWISDANLSATTTIVGSTFRSKFNDFYYALNALKTKMADLAVNPGSKINSTNYASYMDSNSVSILGFGQNQSLDSATLSTSISVNSDSKNVVVVISGRLACDYASSTGGYSNMHAVLTVGGVTKYDDKLARFLNTSSSDSNDHYQVSAAIPLQVSTPGSGSVTYSLTLTRSKTGNGTGGSVAWPTIQVIGLKV